MIALINDLTIQPGNTWVVGSRFADYKGGQFASGRFAEWELQPLDDALRLELARRLLPALHRMMRNLAPAATEARLSPTGFVSALAAHPRAAAWGENPLLFSLAAVVYAQTGTLPQGRAALYAAVVAATLATCAPDPTDHVRLRKLLAQMALRLHQIRGRAFSRADLRAALVATIGERDDTEVTLTRLVNSGALDVLAHSMSWRMSMAQLAPKQDCAGCGRWPPNARRQRATSAICVYSWRWLLWPKRQTAAPSGRHAWARSRCHC